MIRSFPTTLMQDPVFRLRTPDARLVLFTLWMHPSNHLSGLFVLDLDHLALDVRLPLERSTTALRELTDHGLVLRHAPLDQLWLPRMAALLGNLENGEAPVHKAVSKYVHGLVPSTLCHRLLDSLSIPYRHVGDLPDLCAWLPSDGCFVPQATPSDTLSNRVPDRVLSGSGSGLDSGSGTGSEKITSGVATQPDVASRHRDAAKASEREAARIAKDAAKAADKAAKEQAKREAKEAREQERAAAKENAAAATRSYGSTLFQSYRAAFAKRYQTEPLRDARTNAHFSRIAKRTIEGRPEDISPETAIEEASRVCAAYLWSSMPQYLQSNHAPGLLERDWHKLLTEHRTGRQMTPQLANKSAADIKREAELDAYFARQDRTHDAIEVASEQEGRRDF